MLGPGLSQQNNVSQSIVILSALIVCTNSALIIDKLNTIHRQHHQQNQSQELEAEPEQDKLIGENYHYSYYPLPSETIGLETYQSESSSQTSAGADIALASGEQAILVPAEPAGGKATRHNASLGEEQQLGTVGLDEIDLAPEGADEVDGVEDEYDHDYDFGSEFAPEARQKQDSDYKHNYNWGSIGDTRYDSKSKDDSISTTSGANQIQPLVGNATATAAYGASEARPASKGELSIGMDRFGSGAHSKLNQLSEISTNTTGTDHSGRPSECQKVTVNQRSPRLKATSTTGWRKDCSATGDCGEAINDSKDRRRLKRGLRARPKFSRKIFRKISPTKVLVGAHLGSWGYKQYKNWTAQPNGTSTSTTTVAPISLIKLTAIPGPTPSPPLVITSATTTATTLSALPAANNSLTNGQASSTPSLSGEESLANVTSVATQDTEQSNNGSFIVEVAQLFLGLQSIGSSGGATSNRTSSVVAT